MTSPLPSPRTLDSRTVDGFAYTRYEYDSGALGSANTFGLLVPHGVNEVRGTMYFLHGGDGTDEQWLQAGLSACITDDVRALLTSRGVQIALPNIALSFLRDPSPAGGPSHWSAFVDEVLPMAEQQTGTTASTRWITGISMGGAAALSAWLRHPAAFAGVGAHFPGVVTFDPFSDEALAAHAAATGITPTHRDILGACFRGTFTGFDDFARHDPLTLAAQAAPDALAGGRVYLDVGDADDFGLQVGTSALAAALRAKGVACTLTVVPGGRHDAPFLHQRYADLLRYLLQPVQPA